jgi:hypothetical protein
MSIPLRALLFAVILGIAASAQGQINIVNFDFGAVQIACPADYTYEFPESLCAWAPFQNFNAAPGFGWTLNYSPTTYAGGDGLTGPNTSFLPPPFTGLPFSQAVFLQNRPSSVSQDINGFTAGSYILSFYLGSRYSSGRFDGNQTVEALIDGQVIGTWALSSFTPFTLQTANFTVNSSGSHTLEFRGINPGDHTAFLSYVTITRTGH